jgi:transposase
LNRSARPPLHSFTLNQRLAEVDGTLARLVDEHPEAIIFRSLPNAGTLTTAAMLAGFGEDRQRWNGHQEVAARWGLAPVTIQSGKHRTVRRRRACDTTLHQAWLWFAFNTVRKEGCWARADYQARRKAGGDHYTALRCIADRWVKIAYRCWYAGVPYDEAFHQQRRVERQQPRRTK